MPAWLTASWSLPLLSRQWRVFVQAEGDYRTKAENVGLFHVRNANNEMVLLSTVTKVQSSNGPEFTHALQPLPCRAG